MSDDNATIEEPIVACLDCKFYENDNNVAYCTRCAHKTLLCRMASCHEFRMKSPEQVEGEQVLLAMDTVQDLLYDTKNQLIREYNDSVKRSEERHKAYLQQLKSEYDERLLRLIGRKGPLYWLLVTFLSTGAALFVCKLFIEPFIQ